MWRTLSILAIILLLTLPLWSTPSYSTDFSIYGTKNVDGDPSDWTGTPPATAPATTVDDGEFIVTDPSGDYLPFYCSDWNWPIRTDLDILEFRLTGDADNMYLLFKFNTMDNLYSYYIMLAIDLTPYTEDDGFNSWLPDYADTELGEIPATDTHISWQWDYVIGINYDWGDDGSNNFTRIWDHSWDYFNSTGTVVFNQSGKVVEASIPWSEIGGVDAYRNSEIKLWVMVFCNSYGGIWDPYDNSATDDNGNPCLVGSDVYDVAGQTPTYQDTSGEVYDDDGNAGNDNWPDQDHWVDTSFIIPFSSLPEPIPEPYLAPLVAVSIALLASILVVKKLH